VGKNWGSLGKCAYLRKENSAGAALFEPRWSSLTVPPGKWHSGEELLLRSRTTLEQFAPQKILLTRERARAHLDGSHFLKVACENEL
jgi:hypothetical protein